MSKSPEKWIAALIALGLGVVGVGIVVALRPPDRAETSAATSTEVSPVSAEPFTAPGRLELGGDVFCVAPPSSPAGNGRVLKVMVREGDSIKANQVLAVMDTYDRLMAAAMQAQAQVKEAETRLNQVRSGTANLVEASNQQEQVDLKRSQVEAKQAEVLRRAAEFKSAESEFERYKQLFEAGALSASDLERRKLTLQAADAALGQSLKEREQILRQLNQSQQTQNRLAQVRPIEVQQAEAQVQVAVATLERAKADLETAAVRSPITGRVEKVLAKEAEPITAKLSLPTGQPVCQGIAEVSKTDRLYAVAEVDAANSPKVRQGQQVIITGTSLSNQMLGVVEQVEMQTQPNFSTPAPPTEARPQPIAVRIRLNAPKPTPNLINTPVSVAFEP